jgi:hypothetical protein
MYWTIWTALILFAAGAAGRRHHAAWARWSWVAGVLLLVIHIGIAMATAHDWSHAAAIAATARATNAVFGLDWGGGVYANYLFLIVWAADTALWHARRPRAITWTLRIFYLVMILNAAVIFAAGSRRFLGAAIVGTLLWSWRPLRP